MWEESIFYGKGAIKIKSTYKIETSPKESGGEV
jgi:hypothetical protein